MVKSTDAFLPSCRLHSLFYYSPDSLDYQARGCHEGPCFPKELQDPAERGRGGFHCPPALPHSRQGTVKNKSLLSQHKSIGFKDPVPRCHKDSTAGTLSRKTNKHTFTTKSLYRNETNFVQLLQGHMENHVLYLAAPVKVLHK